MVGDLPVEIQVRILNSCPGNSLKQTNSHFYLLYNDLFFHKLLHTFGDGIVEVITKVYASLRIAIISMDAFRLESREVIASRLKLKDCGKVDCPSNAGDVLGAMFIKDSWRYIYSLFKNKRMFAEYSDYKIDEPNNYIFNHYVEINRTYLLSYEKTFRLAPGKYNLNIGLVVKQGRGLGTTKFEVKVKGEPNQKFTFYPPTNINEILPTNQFCLLKIGEFVIPKISNLGQNLLADVQLTMEEIGLYLKSGFTIFFLDIALPSKLFNEFDLLYCSCPESDYKNFINLPLKHFYKQLISIENDMKTEKGARIEGPQLQSELLDLLGASLQEYSKFFYQNGLKCKNFKFNTSYQQHQFEKRYSDKPGVRFGSDWRLPVLLDL